MKAKQYAVICILLALISYVCARSFPNSQTATIISILISVIALSIGIFKIVLKDQSSKKLSYIIILAIGACFLVFGLLLKH